MTKKLEDLNILKFVLKEALKTMRESSDFESIAIRLRENGDFPYLLQIGFVESFVQKENTLNVKDKEGNLVLEADGTPLVECMCGNVLKKRTNPQHQYFTKEGAFWTNSTTQLLENLTEIDMMALQWTSQHQVDQKTSSVPLLPTP